MNLTPDQRRQMDRDYHDAIGAEYDRVILDPRQTASDLLFARLGTLPRTGAMLDIGCGTGQAICRFAATPAHFDSVTGIDHSAGMLKAARANIACSGIEAVKLVHTDVLDWLQRPGDNRYNLITAIGFLHHLSDDQVGQVIEHMAARLSKQGRIVIAEPLDPENRPEPRLIRGWNRRSLAAHVGYSDEPPEPDERPLPRALIESAFDHAGLKITAHGSSWEIFNRTTPPGRLERVIISFLYRWGGPGVVNAWALARS